MIKFIDMTGKTEDEEFCITVSVYIYILTQFVYLVK